jgi:hypothetical protein
MEVGAPPPLRPISGTGISATPSLPQGTREPAGGPIDGVAIEIIEGILTTDDSRREWVSLRLLPPLPGDAGDAADDALTARIASGAGRSGLQLLTALGTIVPQRPFAAALGSVIRFELIARIPLAEAPPAPDPGTAATALGRVASDLLNASGLERLTAALLLLAATPTGLVRVRDAIVNRVRRASDGAADGGLALLSHGGWQIAETESGAVWRVLPFPWLQYGLAEAYVLRRERRPEPSDRPEAPVRFMIEVSLRRFGSLQFDGLYRRGRFDVVLRSHAALAAEIRSAAARRFGEILATGGLAGGLAFSVTPRFAITAAPEPKTLGIEV